MGKLGYLTDRGIREFEGFLSQAKREIKEGHPLSPPPKYLLEGPPFSEIVANDAQLPILAGLRTKRDAIGCLESKLSRYEDTLKNHHIGVWAWLSLYYFDVLCTDDRGNRRILKVEHYIPSRHYQDYYKHLLYSPFMIAQQYPKSAKCLLDRPIYEHSDFMEQVASRPSRLTNQGLIDLIDTLYWDAEAGRPKRGAVDRKLQGNIRRLIAVMDQFDPTFDINGMPNEKLLHLLVSNPRRAAEFSRWLPVSATQESAPA